MSEETLKFDELIEEELEQLDEDRKRTRISSTGRKTRVASRRTQRRRGNKTRNMSRAARRKAAKKAARTRKRDSVGQRKATRKRNKAMKIRRRRGL